MTSRAEAKLQSMPSWFWHFSSSFLVAQLVKNLPAVQETWVWSLGWKDPLEKGKATHSSILAWRISWTPWSPWRSKELDTTEWLSLHFTSLHLLFWSPLSFLVRLSSPLFRTILLSHGLCKFKVTQDALLKSDLYWQRKTNTVWYHLYVEFKK